MLGEQITDLKGKVTGQRVLDAECPTIETSISSKVSAKEVQINEILTFIGRPSSPGVIRGKGQGVFITGESDMATFTGDAFGKMTPSGTKWNGAIFFGRINWQVNISKRYRCCF